MRARGRFDENRARWFALTAKIVLWLSMPAYFVALFLKQELGFIAALEIPVLTASMLILLSMVDRIDRKLQDPNRSPVKTFKSHTEFYRELRAR